MDWDRLQYFLMVARHGTLARAAAALHVDATTVSRHVSALEAALQQTLFERAPTGFVLTAAGRGLVPHAEAMAAAAARIHSAREGGSPLSGQLRVSVSEGFGNSFIAPRLGRFVAAHPELEIDLVASSGFLNPSRREADMAVLLARPRPKDRFSPTVSFHWQWRSTRSLVVDPSVPAWPVAPLGPMSAACSRAAAQRPAHHAKARRL